MSLLQIEPRLNFTNDYNSKKCSQKRSSMNEPLPVEPRFNFANDNNYKYLIELKYF